MVLAGLLALDSGSLASAVVPASRPLVAVPSSAGSTRTRERVESALRNMPLHFVKNEGQADSRVAYYVQGASTSVYLTQEGVAFTLAKGSEGRPHLLGGKAAGSSPQAELWAVHLSFEGANPHAKITGQDRTSAVVSYFTGERSRWKTGLATYGSVVYEELWPGIDLVYEGTAGRLKYTFLVKPGADPGRIRLRYEGASAVRQTDEGGLRVETPVGGFEEQAPYAYQGEGDGRAEVEAAFDPAESSPTESYRFGFHVGEYDRTKLLVLDPVVLTYCGYIGGSLLDEVWGMTVDSAGNAYVVGRTQSAAATFPETPGSFDTTYNAGDDAFVAEVNASGTALVYCTYLGGSLFDVAYDVAVDGSGNAYVAGTTASLNFPAMTGPDLNANGGPADGFVTKVNAGGATLAYSSYIGGAGTDEALAITVDGAGNAYVGGQSDSVTGFPVGGPGDLTQNGSKDGYVAEVNAAGTALVYCGYIGGSADENIIAIAVDGSGNAYVGGNSLSTEAQFFPVLVGPDLFYNGGSQDAFVAKLDPTGVLAYCGFLGGSGVEEVTALAVDGSGNLYMSGTTSSTEATFPVTVGPDLIYNGGSLDAFVGKLDPTGTAFVYLGYVGGTGGDSAKDVAIDGSGRAFITGNTDTADGSFPAWQGPDVTYNGGAHDAYVAMVNPGGTALIFCTYIGGTQDDLSQAIAVDPSGNVYAAGSTTSSQAQSFPVSVGPDLSYAGGGEAWVAKITLVTTAVTLQSFKAVGVAGGVELSWSTASELQNLGFHLYRAVSEAGPYERITAAVIPGLGSSPTGASYSYRDAGLASDTTYFYLLEDIETSGHTERHGPAWAMPGAGGESGGSGPGGDGSDPGGSGGPGTGSVRVTYGEPSGAELRVLERDMTHAVLELRTPGFVARPRSDGTVRLEIPGFEMNAAAGSPAVPTRQALVEAIAGRRVRVASVRPEDVVTFDDLELGAADQLEMVVTDTGTVKPGASRRTLLATERRAGYVPRRWAGLLGSVFQGETKKARLELAPVRHDPASGRTILARRLVVRLEFFGTERGEWALGGSRGRRLPEPIKVPLRGRLAQLAVKEEGLQRVRYEQLFGGSRRGVPVSTLRLSRQGQPVALHVEPAGSTFLPGSELFFWSDGPSLNPWGDAVYELQVGAPGLPMTVIAARPAGPATSAYVETRTLEQNRYYQAGLLEAPDLWQWDLVISPATRSYAFGLDDLAAGSAPAQLTVVLQGASDFPETDHHLRLSVNGVPVGEATWDGKVEKVVEAEIGPGILVEGANTLAVENVGDAGAAYSMVFLDRFAVSYARRLSAVGGSLEGRFLSSGRADVTGLPGRAFVLDTTTPLPAWLDGVEPTALGAAFEVAAGRSYRAVSEAALRAPQVRLFAAAPLRNPERRADWLLIAPREFLTAAVPLVSLRQRQGLEAVAVAVENVFAEFGGGEAGPEAIHDFLVYAYHNWRSAPRYVVLLGDSTYDPKNHLGTGTKDRIPSALVRTSYLWTASDPSLAAVNGADPVPDLAIGRLSAGSLAEAETLVGKLVAYEGAGHALAGPAVLVADNADDAGSFESDADEIASTILDERDVRKIYLRQLGTEGTRAEIRGAFDGGAGLLSYVGHGGTAVWASENIFNNLDVAALQPQAQQPLLLTFDCLNGFFQFPVMDSLAEALVKAEGKGAIAAFAPSGVSLETAAHTYHRALLREIESGRHRTLGDAVLAAQRAYADSGALPELLSVYHLFGDPAMGLQPTAP